MKNESAELREKLREFRNGLPKDQRLLFNPLVGGAVAALRGFTRGAPPAEPGSFAQKLMNFRDGLPPQQREAVTAMVTASGMAWAVAADRAVKDGGTKGGTHDGEQVMYFWLEVAKCVAGLIIAGKLVYDTLDEDDVEAEIPDIELPL